MIKLSIIVPSIIEPSMSEPYQAKNHNDLYHATIQLAVDGSWTWVHDGDKVQNKRHVALIASTHGEMYIKTLCHKEGYMKYLDNQWILKTLDGKPTDSSVRQALDPEDSCFNAVPVLDETCA